MNMNEENFDSLRKLLALKRHEQPPPGYFNDLPGRISARLAAEPPAPFWKNLFPRFHWPTALGYSFSVAIFAVLFFTAQTSLKTGSEIDPVLGGNQPAGVAPAVPAPLDEKFLAENLRAGATNGGGTNLTPELPSFLNGGNLQIERANFPRNDR